MKYNYKESYDYCRSTIFEVSRKLDDKVWLSGHDHWESFTERFVEEVKDKKVFLDIGAGLGFYSMIARKYNPDIEIIAIEADPARADALRYLLDATVYNFAVGSVADTTIMNKPHIGSSSVVGQDDGYRVPVTPLNMMHDQPPFDKVDIMKVDIEGAELEMFKGADLFFEKVHPVLFMEIHNSERIPLLGGDISDLEKILKEYNYDLEYKESRVVL